MFSGISTPILPSPIPNVVLQQNLVRVWAESLLKSSPPASLQQESGESDSCLPLAHKGKELFKETFLLLLAAANGVGTDSMTQASH